MRCFDPTRVYAEAGNLVAALTAESLGHDPEVFLMADDLEGQQHKTAAAHVLVRSLVLDMADLSGCSPGAVLQDLGMRVACRAAHPSGGWA